MDSVAAAAPRLAELVGEAESLVVTVGAGDVTQVGPQLLELLGESASVSEFDRGAPEVTE